MAEIGLASVNTVVNTNDENVRRVKAYFYREGDQIAKLHTWPSLNREATITLSTDAMYSMPLDFDFQYFYTHWNRSDHWPVIGPLTPQEWQFRKSGLVDASGPFSYFRLKWSNGSNPVGGLSFFIDPTPGAGDVGHDVVFEYQSTNWIFPRAWLPSTAYVVGDYVSNFGNIYTCTISGTSDVSGGPTGTSLSIADGTATWAFTDEKYTQIRNDNDIVLIPDELIILGTIIRFLKMTGQSFDYLEREYYEQKKLTLAGIKGARPIAIGRGQYNDIYINRRNMPDGNYGL